MTDKEKIELIIQDKHLNSTQFCNEVCIATGTLSHIRSGRTEPTLNILRNISQAFPDINPAWLFYGEGSMYRNTSSPTPDDASANVEDESQLSGGTTYYNNVRTSDKDAHVAEADGQLPLFAFQQQDTSPSAAHVESDAPGHHRTAPASTSNPMRGTSMPKSVVPAVSVQDIVAETLKQQPKPQRKIVEVRIFFDDGTFETFSSK